MKRSTQSMKNTARGVLSFRTVPADSPAVKLVKLFAGLEIDPLDGPIENGYKALAAALTAVGHPYHVQAIYKWTWPATRQGTNGIIPTSAVPAIQKAARLFGVFLPDGFFDHRVPARRERFAINAEEMLG